MSEATFLYTFLGLMLFNLFASFVYLMGLNQMRMAFMRTITREKRR